ncbi:MAG: phage holin family protein [Mycobacteriales bacterium]
MSAQDEPTTDLTTEPTANQATAEPTLGELVQRASADLSQLMHGEIALAKAEIKADVVNAGKGAGMFGGAGLTGLLALVFVSAGAAFGIGTAWGVWAGFLVVGGAYLLLAAVLALTGKRSLSRVGPPEKTVETVRDDLTWARHPTQQVKAPVS